MVSTISRRERIHQTTLNCNLTPNISSILQRLFHGGRTEAARQHDRHTCTHTRARAHTHAHTRRRRKRKRGKNKDRRHIEDFEHRGRNVTAPLRQQLWKDHGVCSENFNSVGMSYGPQSYSVQLNPILTLARAVVWRHRAKRKTTRKTRSETIVLLPCMQGEGGHRSVHTHMRTINVTTRSAFPGLYLPINPGL